MKSSLLPIASSIAVLLSGSGGAQTKRFAEVGEPLPDGMGQVVAAADFEGDGDVDLFTLTGVFLNESGFFTPGPTLPADFRPGTNVGSCAVADLNGDGRADYVIARLGVQLFAAPPAGGAEFLAPSAPLAGVNLFNECAVADLDGDGDMDVVAAYSSLPAQTWELLVNDGTGVFTPAPAGQWPVESRAAAWVTTGDFDGDGLRDVFASFTSSLANPVWRKNLGGGSFGPSRTLVSTVFGSGAVGDFDGDGFDDILIVDPLGNEAIHRGSPGGLVAGTASPAGLLGTPPVVADLDGDGFDDVLGSDEGPRQRVRPTRLFRCSGGPAGLGPREIFAPVTFALKEMPYSGLAALDVEGDGDLDLAFVPGRGAPALAINDGTGAFVKAPRSLHFGLAALFAPPRDADGDGDADLLSISPTHRTRLVLHRNDGRGVFTDPTVEAGTFTGFGLTEWADLDRDGDSDLWVASTQQNRTDAVLSNDGSGRFTAGQNVPNAAPMLTFVLLDADGDSYPDVVEGKRATGNKFGPPIFHAPTLNRAHQIAAGVVYGPAVEFGVPEAVSDIEVLDADADGDLDLLTTDNIDPSSPRVYVNDGSGAFTTNLQPFGGQLARTLAVGDLDRDGAVDAVLEGQTWLRRGGGYTQVGTHAAPLGAVSVGDLDLDQDLDLVDSAGRWYEGDGAGSFGAPTTFVPYTPFATFPVRQEIEPIDLDADGDLDLMLSTASPGARLAIYRNLTRHAGRMSLVSPGRTTTLSVFGAPSAPWMLASSLHGAAARVLPAFGTLFLDPSSIRVAATGVLPSGGRSDFQAFVPLGLIGRTLTWQAVVGRKLTNAFDTTVLR